MQNISFTYKILQYHVYNKAIKITVSDELT